jgi:response regulator of citrate/malate metabolism
MKITPIKIVVIHDGLIPKVDPLLVMLRLQFGDENVLHYENSNEGLEYVLANLGEKTIVLLDKNFSQGEKSGIQVFEEIRKKSSLVYIILITADEYYKISSEDLILLINHDAFAIENVTSDYTKIISLVENASHKLNARIDAVLEEWIARHKSEDRERPLVKTKEGKVYSMNDVLESIRLQTQVGKEFESNLTKLAIEIFSKQKPLA